MSGCKDVPLICCCERLCLFQVSFCLSSSFGWFYEGRTKRTLQKVVVVKSYRQSWSKVHLLLESKKASISCNFVSMEFSLETVFLYYQQIDGLYFRFSGSKLFYGCRWYRMMAFSESATHGFHCWSLLIFQVERFSFKYDCRTTTSQ